MAFTFLFSPRPVHETSQYSHEKDCTNRPIIKQRRITGRETIERTDGRTDGRREGRAMLCTAPCRLHATILLPLRWAAKQQTALSYPGGGADTHSATIRDRELSLSLSLSLSKPHQPTTTAVKQYSFSVCMGSIGDVPIANYPRRFHPIYLRASIRLFPFWYHKSESLS